MLILVKFADELELNVWTLFFLLNNFAVNEIVEHNINVKLHD